MPDLAHADQLLLHCKELVTLRDGPAAGPRRRDDLRRLGVLADGAIAVRAGRIAAVGPSAELLARYTAPRCIDLSDFVVLPGFVDCHTHPVFVGTREDEFHARIAGADYLAIAAAGGGILRSMRGVREASLEQLVDATQQHLESFLFHGTTTIEAKSGYGLSTEAERKSLAALAAAAKRVPLTVRRTFLGAHEFPPEYRDRRDDYVQLVVDEMLPAARELATSCDVFAEPKVFDRAQSQRILAAARSLGYRLRVHADEIEPMGGAELAVELGADSADHLARVSLEGIERLAQSDTVAVLLPGTSFLLDKGIHAPARPLLERGCAVALATDFNPGSCHVQSMPEVISLACVLLKMTPEECIAAATINAAFSLQLDQEIGTLHDGKRCDLVALDLPSWRSLGYELGGNPVALTIKDGVPVAANLRERDPEV
jgi:imidazolonepropionase